MPQLSEDEKRRLFMTLDLHTKQNEKLERGIYGDEANKVLGALDRISNLEGLTSNIVDKMHQEKVKRAYHSGKVAGMVTVILFALKMFWDWVVNKPKG